MSTILDALRKLQREKDETRGPRRTRPSAPKSTAHGRAGRGRVVALVVLLLASGAAGFWLLSGQRQRPTVVTEQREAEPAVTDLAAQQAARSAEEEQLRAELERLKSAAEELERAPIEPAVALPEEVVAEDLPAESASDLVAASEEPEGATASEAMQPAPAVAFRPSRETAPPIPESPMPAPVAKQEAPMPAAPAPVEEQEAPMPALPAPVAKQEAPMPAVPTPVAKQEAPMPAVPTPVAKQEAPMPALPAPVAKREAPMPTVPAPVAKRPAAKPEARPESVASIREPEHIPASIEVVFPDLIVESVRWHPDPRRRVAKLTLPTLKVDDAHEGEEFDGVRITRIDPAAVEIEFGNSRKLIRLGR